MRPARPLATAFATSFLIAALVVAGLPVLRAALSAGGVDIASRSVDVSIDQQRLVRLPIAASHVVLHWTGTPEAQITVALGRSADQLSEEIPAGLADGSGEDGDLNYSEVIWADGARWARVTSDRPIEHLSVVAMDTDESRGVDQSGVVGRGGQQAGGDHPRRLGRERVVLDQFRRLHPLRPELQPGPEADRPSHGRPEQRPESRGDDPRDLLRPRHPARLRRHRLQLPDRRAGPGLRRPARVGLHARSRTRPARTWPATSSGARTPSTTTMRPSASSCSATSPASCPRRPRARRS